MSVCDGARPSPSDPGRTVPQVVGPATGGIRTHVRCLASGLTQRGIVAPLLGPAGVLPDGEGAGVVDVPSGASPVGWWRARRQLGPWRTDADIVHAHGIKAASIAGSRRGGPPMVMTLHNVPLPDASGRVPVWRTRLTERTLGGATRIIVPAAWMVDEVPRSHRARVRVVAPAAPAPVVRRDRDAVRADWGVTSDVPVAVCVARLHPQKGLDALVDAWRVVRSTVPRAELVIVGDGPERAALERRVADGTTGVRLFGASANAADLMAAADVVVISSVWEALPLVLIEALQLGRPVVSTDVGVARELLDGDAAGDVVPVGDAPALAAALIDRLTGSRSPGPAGGHVATAERFAPDALIDAVVDVYRELW